MRVITVAPDKNQLALPPSPQRGTMRRWAQRIQLTKICIGTKR